ncbi:hypothetical protein [uncultured Microbacterium sp.]|uniref:hypothetical protein n=1 Tax=uncultured Microbacterium sp. TaxID=191216 RepID=UPI0028D6C382|nr:hypothetical protein [uncultured Microbacterium sp.]
MILIENTLTGRSPTRYGNLTVDEQCEIAEAATQRHGLNLRHLITLWDIPRWDRGSRLINMLDCLKEQPAHILIVPSPLYRGFTETATRKHRRVLERHGTTLLITEQ